MSSNPAARALHWAFLVLCLACVPVRAQTPTPSPAPIPPAAESGSGSGSGSGSESESESESGTRTGSPSATAHPAQAIVARGEALFAAGNYDAALGEFAQAYELLAGHPRQYIVLHNLALCHERSFRYDSALAYYQRYLQEGGPEAEDRALIERVMITLRSLLGKVEIASNVRAELWVDDRRLGDAPGTRLLPAGRHVIELRAPLYESVRREVDVRARAQHRLRFELERLSQYAGPGPVFFWTGAGLTLVATATGAILGANALVEDADGRERMKRDPFANTVEDEARVERLARAADIAFGAAAVLAVSSTVLFFLTDWDSGERESGPAANAHAASGKLRVEPWLGRSEAGLTVRGALRP
jgi:tetratricopeptide (TPR) repeat protein